MPFRIRAGTTPDNALFRAGIAGFAILLDDHIGHHSGRVPIAHQGAVLGRSRRFQARSAFLRRALHVFLPVAHFSASIFPLSDLFGSA